MKTTKAMLIYFISFVVGYLLLSTIGVMFHKIGDIEGDTHYGYTEILGSTAWFTIYSLFIGWWIAAIVACEYLQKKEGY